MGNQTAHLDGVKTAGRVQRGQILPACALIGLPFYSALVRRSGCFGGVGKCKLLMILYDSSILVSPKRGDFRPS